MTKKKKHKQRVRARMETTGENFTKALDNVEAEKLGVTEEELDVEFPEQEELSDAVRCGLFDYSTLKEIEKLEEVWETPRYMLNGPYGSPASVYVPVSGELEEQDAVLIGTTAEVRSARRHPSTQVELPNPLDFEELATRSFRDAQVTYTMPRFNEVHVKHLKTKIPDHLWVEAFVAHPQTWERVLRGLDPGATWGGATVVHNETCPPGTMILVSAGETLVLCFAQVSRIEGHESRVKRLLHMRHDVAAFEKICGESDMWSGWLRTPRSDLYSDEPFDELFDDALLLHPARWEKILSDPRMTHHVQQADPEMGHLHLGRQFVGTFGQHMVVLREDWPEDIMLILNSDNYDGQHSRIRIHHI